MKTELIMGGEDPVYVDESGTARDGLGNRIACGSVFPIYHWSPSARHKRIRKFGVVPGSLSVDRSWRPPYTCWSDSPSLAWALSGQTHLGHDTWDLWMTWSNVPSSLHPMGERPCEFRVFERIFKRDLWHVGMKHHSLEDESLVGRVIAYGFGMHG